MKEHPILFNTEMVRAVLEGRKTETRRIIKPQPNYHLRHGQKDKDLEGNVLRRCPYGQVGDRLWVRETFSLYTWKPVNNVIKTEYIYRADDPPYDDIRWKPSIFLPREASRITLKITEIKVVITAMV